MMASTKYFIRYWRPTIGVCIIPFVLGLLSARGLSAQKPPVTYAAIFSSTVDEVPRSMKSFDVEPMTLRDRFSYYERHTYDPVSLLSPIIPAALIMSFPPHIYPREWRDGGGALGRNIGSSLAMEVSADTAKFLVGSLTHEDPRYFPARGKGVVHRTLYALPFTVVDRSEDGGARLAISNFAGAAAAGFVGNAYLPPGFEDSVHVWQRAGGTLGGYVPTLLVGYADGNLISEFEPELRRLGRRLNLPRIAQ